MINSDNNSDNENEDNQSDEERLHLTPGFLQSTEIESSLSKDDNNEDEEENHLMRKNKVMREIKNSHSKKINRIIKLVTDLPGFINPHSKVFTPPQFRFSESQQNEDFYNPNQKNSDPNLPSKEMEIIRQEGLSNGVVLSNNKRTANFETGEFAEMYSDLIIKD